MDRGHARRGTYDMKRAMGCLAVLIAGPAMALATTATASGATPGLSSNGASGTPSTTGMRSHVHVSNAQADFQWMLHF
jgi:hypothetical protein